MNIFKAFFMAFISGEGITVGAHRLYSHKAFKAKFVTRLVLMILQTMAGQVKLIKIFYYSAALFWYTFNNIYISCLATAATVLH